MGKSTCVQLTNIAVYNVTCKQLRSLLGNGTDGSSKICRDIGDFNEVNLQSTQGF